MYFTVVAYRMLSRTSGPKRDEVTGLERAAKRATSLFAKYN
jgi:hypothetical protein